MYACHAAELPGYVWTSTTDQTDALPGWSCERLEKPLEGSTLSQWLSGYKIASLIEQLPF